MYVKFFAHKFLRDLQTFHFVFNTTISKMSLKLGHYQNRLLTSVFVLVSGIVFNRSNGLMIKCSVDV